MNINSSKKTVGLIASIFFAILFTFSSSAVYAKSYEVAYLSASSANTWLGASVKTMEAVAAANDINITEFDGQFDPAKQNAQLQDIIASGKYQGIIVCAAYGVGMIPDLEEAIAAGIDSLGDVLLGAGADTFVFADNSDVTGFTINGGSAGVEEKKEG